MGQFAVTVQINCPKNVCKNWNSVHRLQKGDEMGSFSDIFFFCIFKNTFIYICYNFWSVIKFM